MPVAKVRARNVGLAIEVDIDAKGGIEALKASRRDVARRLRELQQQAAQDKILPAAKRNSQSLNIGGEAVAGTLVITKASTPVLTTRLRGIRGRALGLLEFGGTVRTQILPKRKQALSFGGQHPVSRVRTVRHYRARKVLSRAVASQYPEFAEDLRDRIVTVFAQRMDVK